MSKKVTTHSKCSLCHKRGHNRRTCGGVKSVKRQNWPTSSYMQAGEPFLNAGRSGNTLYHTIEQAFERKRELGVQNVTSNVENNKANVVGTEGVAGEENVDYALTWWELVKPESDWGYTDGLTDFITQAPLDSSEAVEEEMKRKIVEYAPLYKVEEIVEDSNVPISFAFELAQKYNLWDNLVQHQSKKMPLWVLRKAMRSENHIARCAVARHPNTTPDMLEELFSDKHVRVRRTVVKNLLTPQHLVEQAAIYDRSQEVREVAVAKLKLREKIAERKNSN